MTTLPNGLRVVTDSVFTVDSLAIGVWAGVGTRHEDMSENGVAHMVEHMLFKGTPTRDAQKLSEVIEDVGGNINAYTCREITAYYIHLLKDHMDLALDVLADILQNSTMPQDEIERERGVILQEIKMYMDTPDRLVFDNFQEAAYPNQSLGAPALGRPDIIKNMTRESLMGYVAKHYTPANLVVSVAGPVHHDEFVKKVEALFTHLPAGNKTKSTFVPAQYAPVSFLQEQDTEQAHITLGFNAVKRTSDKYAAFRILSSVLGGGMSSRLFQEVREKRGLVYSIQSFYDSFHDDGLFGIYAGTGPELLAELMPVVIQEIKNVTDRISENELKRAKTQIKSGILMARESMLTRADQAARHMLYFDKPVDMNRFMNSIELVTAGDVTNLAKEIFATKPTLAAIGPLQGLMSYDEMIGLLRQ